jgi:hypothetical protein
MHSCLKERRGNSMHKLGKLTSAVALGAMMSLALVAPDAFAQSANQSIAHKTAQVATTISVAHAAVPASSVQLAGWGGGWGDGGFGGGFRGARATRITRFFQITRFERIEHFEHFNRFGGGGFGGGGGCDWGC